MNVNDVKQELIESLVRYKKLSQEKTTTHKQVMKIEFGANSGKARLFDSTSRRIIDSNRAELDEVKLLIKNTLTGNPQLLNDDEIQHKLDLAQLTSLYKPKIKIQHGKKSARVKIVKTLLDQLDIGIVHLVDNLDPLSSYNQLLNQLSKDKDIRRQNKTLLSEYGIIRTAIEFPSEGANAPNSLTLDSAIKNTVSDNLRFTASPLRELSATDNSKGVERKYLNIYTIPMGIEYGHLNIDNLRQLAKDDIETVTEDCFIHCSLSPTEFKNKIAITKEISLLETDTDYQKLVKYTRDFFRAFENHKTRDFKKPNSKYTTHLDRISFDYTELIARIKEESASDPLGFIELLSAELKPIVPYLPTKSIQELIDSGAINPVDYVDVTPKIKHIASSDVRFTYEYVENKDIAWDFFQPDLCIPLGGEAGKAALVKWQDRERLYDFEGAKSFPEVKEIGAHYQPHIVVIDCDTKEIRKLIQKILLDANLYYGCMLNKTKGTGQLFFQLDTSDVRRTLDVFNSKFTIGSLKFRHKAHIDILVFGKGYSRITESKELRLFATTKRGTLSGIS